jgi:hypothetical protein
MKPSALLVGMENGAAIMEDYQVVPHLNIESHMASNPTPKHRWSPT